MIPDLTDIFARYENLRAEADTLFDRVREACPQCVTCKEGCSDCCHAMFDLSLVEAMALNRAFNARFGFGAARSAVLEAAVIGVPDAQGLVKTKSYVVCKPGQSTTEEELKAFVKERLAPYKYPRSIEFMDELPKTATGKIQRFRLRDLESKHK